MIRAAIIDDETDAIKVLSVFMSMNFPDIKLAGAYEHPSEAITALKRTPPDLLFLDIDMPGINGFEVLKAIGTEYMQCIFVTAHQQYAIKALKMNAADYLLKPVDEVELVEAVRKVLKKSEQKEKTDHQALLSSLKLQSPRIHVSTGKGVQFLHCEQILYIQADGNYCTIFLEKGKKLTTVRKIHEFEEILRPYTSFARIHKSYLVNLEKVDEYLKEGIVCLGDGSIIPVSRKYKEVLKELLGF